MMKTQGTQYHAKRWNTVHDAVGTCGSNFKAPLVLHGPANTLNWMDETHHILRSFSKKRLGRLQRQSCFLNWFARLSAVQTKSSTKWRPPPAAPHRVVWPWPSLRWASCPTQSGLALAIATLGQLPHRVVWPWPFNPSTAAWFPPSIRWTSRLAPPSPNHRSAAMFLHLSPIHGSQPAKNLPGSRTTGHVVQVVRQWRAQHRPPTNFDHFRRFLGRWMLRHLVVFCPAASCRQSSSPPAPLASIHIGTQRFAPCGTFLWFRCRSCQGAERPWPWPSP